MENEALIAEIKKLTADLARAEFTIGAVYQICSKDTTTECHILDLIGVYFRQKESK